MPLSYDKFFLASKSPRRLELLQLINIFPSVLDPNFHEIHDDRFSPTDLAVSLALGKLKSVRNRVSEGIILSADTLVLLDNEILGKPQNDENAENMLVKLSGKWHSVITGFAVCHQKKDSLISKFCETRVHFRNLKPDEIRDYIATGGPFDKAGSYGIQDAFGAIFVDEIQGDYYNVVGLPLSLVYSTIRDIISD